MSWCFDFGFFFVTCPEEQQWSRIYVCLLPFYLFIVGVKTAAIFSFSHCFIFKDSWHQSIVYVIEFNKVLLTFERKQKRKTFDFLTKFIEACLLYMLAALYLTDNSGSFCFLKLLPQYFFSSWKNSDCIIFILVVCNSIDSSKSIRWLYMLFYTERFEYHSCINNFSIGKCLSLSTR